MAIHKLGCCELSRDVMLWLDQLNSCILLVLLEDMEDTKDTEYPG